MNDQASNEQREGLRRIDVITRNIPTIEFEEVLVKHGWIVEYCRGIMLVTKP